MLRPGRQPRLYVDEGGVPLSDRQGWHPLSETGDFQYGFTAQVAPGAGAWSAEFRIEESLGGPEQAVGLAVDLVREIEGELFSQPGLRGAMRCPLNRGGMREPGTIRPFPEFASRRADRSSDAAGLSAEQSVFLSGLGSFDPEGAVGVFLEPDFRPGGPVDHPRPGGGGIRGVAGGGGDSPGVCTPGLGRRLDSAPAKRRCSCLPPPARNGNGHPASGELGDDGFVPRWRRRGVPGIDSWWRHRPIWWIGSSGDDVPRLECWESGSGSRRETVSPPIFPGRGGCALEEPNYPGTA